MRCEHHIAALLYARHCCSFEILDRAAIPVAALFRENQSLYPVRKIASLFYVNQSSAICLQPLCSEGMTHVC